MTLKYRREVDGLRALAVLPVILFHAGFPVFAGGFVGVDIFFVISGYLITGILIRELDAGQFSLLNFYERRARRILPALFVVMLACIPFAWAVMLPSEMKDFAQSFAAAALSVSNILFWLESGYFDQAAELKPLLHTWSLGVEEQFYILFPPFLALLWRFGRTRPFLVLGGLGVLSLIVADWASYRFPSANFYLLPFRGWELIAGGLCALWQVRAPAASPRLGWLGLLGLALIAGSILGMDEQTRFPSLWGLIPVGGTCLILLFADRHSLTGRLLGWAPFVGIGLISYSAYLWHQPLLAFGRLWSTDPLSVPALLALSAASLPLAWVTWRYVETPFRKRGAGTLLPTRGAVFAFSGAGLGVMVALGAWGHIRDGMPGRMPAEFADRSTLLEDNHLARQTDIRAGICHFNQSGRHRSLTDFLNNWDCGPDSDPDRPGLNIAIYGDSHAADKVMALRHAGVNPLQIGGASCPLLPGDLPPYCAALTAHLHAQTKAAGIRTILLANKFQDHELTPEYLGAVAEYWGAHYDRVVLFAPMPLFEGMRKRYLRGGAPALATQIPDLHATQAFGQAIAEAGLEDRIEIIDTLALFCQDRPGCAPVIADQPLLTDSGHLSRHGADLLGQALLRGFQP